MPSGAPSQIAEACRGDPRQLIDDSRSRDAWILGKCGLCGYNLWLYEVFHAIRVGRLLRVPSTAGGFGSVQRRGRPLTEA